jgi:hypothetical protein
MSQIHRVEVRPGSLTLPEDNDWFYEINFDGNRISYHAADSGV